MSPLFLPITNHTGRINLQIQSSYKSKVSQKYVSLLYIANVYFFSQSIQNLCYSTQPVLIFQHIINIFIIELHNHLENRSFFCNTTPSPHIFFIFISLFWSLLHYFTTRWSQSVHLSRQKEWHYCKLAGVWNDQLCPNTEHAFCQFATAMLSFFIYIFQTGFIYKTKIYHLSCKERTIHTTWNAMSNTATESLVAHCLNSNSVWLRWRKMHQRLPFDCKCSLQSDSSVVPLSKSLLMFFHQSSPFCHDNTKIRSMTVA